MKMKVSIWKEQKIFSNSEKIKPAQKYIRNFCINVIQFFP